MRVGFFSHRSITPLHPRLVAFRNYFQKLGHEVEFINCSQPKPDAASRINWISLWFFDLMAVKRCKPLIQKYDWIFVCDLKYLPLVRYTAKQKKFTVYDTIDHNVELRFYQLQEKIPFLRILKSPIIHFFRLLERRIANQSNAITVNSLSLQEYLKPKARTLFYSSPFESFQLSNNPTNPPAILYLGTFSSEKGSSEILGLVKRLNIPLFIFGDISTAEIKNACLAIPSISVSSRIGTDVLQTKIAELMKKYFLFGLSMIKPAHFSYEVQEANKDIDYLALGVPIIGNYRITTKQKIDDGCGLFFDDKELTRFVHDQVKQKVMSKKCIEIYNATYHSAYFEKVLDEIIPS